MGFSKSEKEMDLEYISPGWGFDDIWLEDSLKGIGQFSGGIEPVGQKRKNKRTVDDYEA